VDEEVAFLDIGHKEHADLSRKADKQCKQTSGTASFPHTSAISFSRCA